MVEDGRMIDLRRRIAEAARTPVLLVACDYDGTLAPIVVDPAEARPLRETIVALRELAALPNTHVAVISGRSLRDLSTMLENPPDVHLVGSHGSEFDPGFAESLSPEARTRLSELREHARSAAARGGQGFLLEEKPASIAFHYRAADESRGREIVDSLLREVTKGDGVHIKLGRRVVELSVIPTDKGVALQSLRQRFGASATVYFGDDITDEDVFAVLRGPDVGVKVGQCDSRAPHRAADPLEVARLLAFLCERRAAWAAGAAAVPIERHSMLSDQRTMALVAPQGRIVWLCLPRLDSPAIFAELLGGPAAGYFSITPDGGGRPPRQRYIGGTLALRTQWKSMRVSDFLDVSGGKFKQRAGRTDLVRILEGRGRARIEFAPRLDFGREPTRLEARENGIVITGTHDPIVLRSPGIVWSIIEQGNHRTAKATVELDGTHPLVLSLCYGTGSLRQDTAIVIERMRTTARYWSNWSRAIAPAGPHRNLIKRSALTLKALCYGPTGAIAAAATTSLPEQIGGVRNWDYRYCWLRDASMSAAALVRLGSQDEAMHFLDWLLGVLSQRTPERLQPLYSVLGEALGPEAEIGELSGYAGSRPVRVGNAAARQVQLDVFGPIMELIALLVDRDAPLSSDHWRLVDDVVQAVERRWREPDHGIWEVRRPPRHHVHTKVMCWQAVDRAIRIADRFYDRRHDRWATLRDEIRDDVVAHGFKPEQDSFTAAYDGVDLDAAALCTGLSGMLAPHDRRFLGTVRAIETHLRDGPAVFRYRTSATDDGLPGSEGAFHLCSLWLVEAYVLVGRVQEARQLFLDVASLAGPTGLLSEQFDPREKRALGNHPQAYSHLALIDAALRLEQGLLPASAQAVSCRGPE
jgi:trehalose-phosphatase